MEKGAALWLPPAPSMRCPRGKGSNGNSFSRRIRARVICKLLPGSRFPNPTSSDKSGWRHGPASSSPMVISLASASPRSLQRTPSNPPARLKPTVAAKAVRAKTAQSDREEAIGPALYGARRPLRRPLRCLDGRLSWPASSSSTRTAVAPWSTAAKAAAKEKLRSGHRGVGRGLPQVGPIIVYFGKTNPKYWRYFKVLTIQKFEIFVALPEFPPGRLNCILTICPSDANPLPDALCLLIHLRGRD